MRLSVHHVTRFAFDQPSGHSIHDVRLTPKPAAGQRLLSWRIEGPGKHSEWLDGHGNQVTTFSVARQHQAVEITVTGLYEFVGADQWLRDADAAGALLAAQSGHGQARSGVRSADPGPGRSCRRSGATCGRAA